MKKILVGVLFSAFVFTGFASLVSASSLWNGASNDCRGLAIANFTANKGIVDPCWPLASVSAVDGDSINIRIYYHNTSSQPATNVKVFIDAPTGTGSSQTFSGRIASDQGGISLGNVTANVPSGASLIFGGTHWLPNQRQTESSLLYGQDGSDVLDQGLNIGTIAPGWDTQGSVVVVFRVEKPKPTGEIHSEGPSCYISAGQSNCSIPFSWSTNNPVGTSVVKTEGVTYKTGNSGSYVPFLIPFGTSVFTLYNNNTELDEASVSVSCEAGSNWNSSKGICEMPKDCEISNFSANPTEVTKGDGVTLSWSTNYCKNVSISGVGSNLSPNSSKVVYPEVSTTYTLTGFGDTSKTPTATAYVTVGGPVGAPGYPVGAPSYDA